MDFKQLNYICAIAKHHNMTKAAAELFVSQSTLSLYLSKLEEDVGTKLFLRRNNHLQITPAGELYVQTAQKMLQTKSKLYAQLHNMTDYQEIRFGMASCYSLRVMAEILNENKDYFSSIKITVTEGRGNPMLKKLESGDLDFALCGRKNMIQPDGCIVDRLIKEPFVILISPESPLAYMASTQDQPPPIADMSAFSYQNYIACPPDTADAQIGADIFRRFNITPTTVCEINDTQVKLSMVRNNLGMTAMPITTVSEKSLLWCRPPINFYRHIIIVYKNDRILTDAENTLIQKLHEKYEAKALSLSLNHQNMP